MRVDHRVYTWEAKWYVFFIDWIFDLMCEMCLFTDPWWFGFPFRGYNHLGELFHEHIHRRVLRYCWRRTKLYDTEGK